MVRKISFAILSIAIVITGLIAFKKLSYWDRSVRIFSFSSDAPFEGRMGRHGEMQRISGSAEDHKRFDGREGFIPEELGELSDSLKARFESIGRQNSMWNRDISDSLRARSEAGEGHLGAGLRDRNIPDSLRRQFGTGNRGWIEGNHFERGMRNGRDLEVGEFHGGRRVNLRNVMWFLAVFASNTAVVIYVDKAYNFLFKRKEQMESSV